MADLGDRIKKQREKMRLTQKDLSNKTGLTIVQVSRYENNERKPDPEALSTLVDALETNADYLLGRTNDPSPTNAKLTAAGRPENGPYMAYFGGPPKELDEEEAAHLEQELEMFRAFREKRLREKGQQKDK
jgi:transcriptional regulator with XRE-family HTH domain